MVSLGFSRGAGRVTIVVDKPEYLSPPRLLLHQIRQKKVGIHSGTTVEFTQPSGLLPRGKEYASALSLPNFISKLLAYVTDCFIEIAKQNLVTGQSVLIDSAALEQPVLLLANTVSASHYPQSER